MTEAQNPTNDITIFDPKQQRFIHLYLSGQYKIPALAQLLDVHVNTVRGWLRRADMQEIIASYQRDEHEIVESSLKSLRMKAVEKMNQLVDSPIDGIAFQACKDILDRTGHKSKQEIKIDKTVRTYEEKLSDLIEATVEGEFSIVE